jgi:hypothetical protein
MAAKKKVGRPTKYEPKMCEIVINCGKEGMSKCEMALELDIAYDTFDRWQNQNKKFSEAVKEAMRHSQAWWERNGRMATFGGIDGFNATSYIFNMKNRFRDDWNDTMKNEHSGPDGGPIVQKIERVIVDPKEA